MKPSADIDANRNEDQKKLQSMKLKNELRAAISPS